MVNTSTEYARIIVGELIARGVSDVVIAPGSRSAALAYACAQAEQAGALHVHVRIDERDAGFLALGLAKASRRIVPVIVTSGSAVANLVPAIVEAYQSGIALLAITADRPASARGTTAAQTMNQVDLFGTFVVASHDLPSTAGQALHIRDTVQQIAHVMQEPRLLPGHLNFQCEPPLMPDVDDLDWAPRPYSREQRATIPTATESIQSMEFPAHGLVIVGDTNGAECAGDVHDFAQSLGWPVMWEPSSNVHGISEAIAHGVLLLGSSKVPAVDCIVTIGTVGLSRPITQALRTTPCHVAIHLSTSGPLTPDPVGTASAVLHGIPRAHTDLDAEWLPLWKRLSTEAQIAIDAHLNTTTLQGPQAALTVWNHADDSAELMVAASWPVRHLEAFAPARQGLKTYGNRGVNGIDGLISTAWGIALTGGTRTYLLIGDVATLHDLGGLNVSDHITQPNLTIVVLDNDGGGIFSQLEQSGPEFATHYEKIFGTPHGRDLWVIAESLGIPASRVTSVPELTSALARTDAIPGVHVIVCTTGTRVAEAALLDLIGTAVHAHL